MALCRAFRNPALFIAFTANPKWHEVVEMLSYIRGHKANDRSEIMTRIFRLKLKQLKRPQEKQNLWKEQSKRKIRKRRKQRKSNLDFSCVAKSEEVCTEGREGSSVKVRTTKLDPSNRGALKNENDPDVKVQREKKMLSLLRKNKTPTSTESTEIDDIISAEIPCKLKQPEAHKLVVEHMVHGPCRAHGSKRKEFRFPGLELNENHYCLLRIEEILTRNGKSLADFPEMSMPEKSLLIGLDNRLIQEELSYNISMLIEEHQSLHSCLTIRKDQSVMKSLIQSNSKKGCFISCTAQEVQARLICAEQLWDG
ncbi:hypothetical protein V2J09_011056 [Rumex salicifolius]